MSAWEVVNKTRQRKPLRLLGLWENNLLINLKQRGKEGLSNKNPHKNHSG